MSEGDHCHVIYEDRNKYRKYVFSLRGPKVNKTGNSTQHSPKIKSTDACRHFNKDSVEQATGNFELSDS